MAVSADEFRAALRLFPSGVTIVTIRAGERQHGLTVSAFVSVSADPAQIAVVVDRANRGHALLVDPAAVFAVNVLRREQRELAERFAARTDDDRFAAGEWSTAATGAPILTDALAWLDCRLAARHPAGTHSICVGAVVAAGVAPGAAPLVYWNRDYRALKDR